MDFIYWIIIIIILIIIIVAVVCILLFIPSNSKTLKPPPLLKGWFPDTEVLVDTLVHFAANKQNLMNTIYKINYSYDFLSLTDLLNTSNQYNYTSGISDKNNIIISYDSDKNTFNNTEENILQGYTELKHLNNYNAVSLKHSFPIDKLVYITGEGLYCYLRKYARLLDGKKYTFIQIKLDYQSDASKTYLILASLLDYLKNNFNDDFIIVGNFNVQGHEMVFKNYFADSDYFICPLYKTITLNNSTNGLAAYDGLVVSKNLYKSIQYQIDFSQSDSDRYILVAYMYYLGTYAMTDISDSKFKNYVSKLSKLNTNNNFINNSGTYDNTNIKSDVSLISQTDPKSVTKDNYTIYSNEKMNKKLETIEVMNT